VNSTGSAAGERNATPLMRGAGAVGSRWRSGNGRYAMFLRVGSKRSGRGSERDPPRSCCSSFDAASLRPADRRRDTWDDFDGGLDPQGA
jgi:hypothetical protein